jgi:hypothetical protein
MKTRSLLFDTALCLRKKHTASPERPAVVIADASSRFVVDASSSWVTAAEDGEDK